MRKFQEEYLHVHCNRMWQGLKEQWLSKCKQNNKNNKLEYYHN